MWRNCQHVVINLCFRSGRSVWTVNVSNYCEFHNRSFANLIYHSWLWYYCKQIAYDSQLDSIHSQTGSRLIAKPLWRRQLTRSSSWKRQRLRECKFIAHTHTNFTWNTVSNHCFHLCYCSIRKTDKLQDEHIDSPFNAFLITGTQASEQSQWLFSLFLSCQ